MNLNLTFMGNFFLKELPNFIKTPLNEKACYYNDSATLLSSGSNILTAQNYHDTSVNNNLKPFTSEQYLKKSRDQKKAATFMEVGGCAMLFNRNGADAIKSFTFI